MTTQDNADPNLDDMSMEDIEAYQESLRSGEEFKTAETIETVENQEEDKAAINQSGTQEALIESKPEEKQAVFLSPYLKGKSVEEAKGLIQKQLDYIAQNKATAEELEQIYLDNMRTASQIDTTRGDLKKKLRETPKVELEQDEDDPLNQFDPETVKATELLVNRVISNNQTRVIKQQESIRNDNYQYLQSIKNNPAIYSIIEPELTKEVTANPSIVFQPGWIQESAMRVINSALSSPRTEPKQNLSSKKQAASTIGAGGGFTPSKPTKSEDDMSAEEYLAHMQAKGLIRTG